LISDSFEVVITIQQIPRHVRHESLKLLSSGFHDNHPLFRNSEARHEQLRLSLCQLLSNLVGVLSELSGNDLFIIVS